MTLNFFFDNDWLNRIADAWLIFVEREPHHETKGGDPLLEANKVLARLDRYMQYLLPDAQTYKMVVDAVTIQGTDGTGAVCFLNRSWDGCTKKQR
jgi:hypothetical protein